MITIVTEIIKATVLSGIDINRIKKQRGMSYRLIKRWKWAMLSETNQGKVCGAGWANNKLTHEGWLLSQRRRTVRLLWAERPASYWLESNTRSRRGANCRQPVKKHTNYLLAFKRQKFWTQSSNIKWYFPFPAVVWSQNKWNDNGRRDIEDITLAGMGWQ